MKPMRNACTVTEAARRDRSSRQSIYDFVERHPSVIVRKAKPMLLDAHRIDELAYARYLVFGREEPAA